MKTIIWIIAAIVILGGAWWYFTMPVATVTPAPTPAVTDTGATNQTGAATTGSNSSASTTGGAMGAPMTASVIYGAQGFSPSTVTIAKGGTVTWTNQTGSSMWIASNPHPTHQGYSGTMRSEHCPDTAGAAFDQCAPGSSYSFTFNKTGTWGYHDHLNSNQHGTVIVQ